MNILEQSSFLLALHVNYTVYLKPLEKYVSYVYVCVCVSVVCMCVQKFKLGLPNR